MTNTRQIGVKHTIEISRGAQGTFGFGLTSRDVSTNEEDHPIYVKSITSQGPAFHDGRLRLGDRILEVSKIIITLPVKSIGHPFIVVIMSLLSSVIHR